MPPTYFRPTAKATTTAVYPLTGQVPKDLSKTTIWTSNYAALGGVELPPQTEIVDADIALSTSQDTLLNTENGPLYVTLGKPANDGQVLNISLLTRRSNPAYVSCVAAGGGTFVLTASNPSRRLVYVNGAWQAIESGYSAESPDSFFPTTQQGPRLTGSDVQPGTYGFGEIVSMSADGNTLAVGDGYANDFVGAMYVFVRTGTSWTQQAKLVPSDTIGTSYLWTSALSADGNTLAVGGVGNDDNIGATWVFIRNGTTWTQQGPALVGTGYVISSGGFVGQGSMLSLSADGNTLATGAISDNNYVGAVWIFVRTGTTWSQQGSKLVGSGYVNIPWQGNGLDLSADGNTLAVGGYQDNTNQGAVWIFVRNGTTWTQQGSKLVATGGTGAIPRNGYSVSLSADGNILASGAFDDNSGIGAVFIFSRSGTTWTQQGSKLVSSNANALRQGQGVALSADGYTLVVGAPAGELSCVVIWVNSGDFQWRQETVLFGNPAYTYDTLGLSVACSANANCIVAGAPYGDTTPGIIVFV